MSVWSSALVLLLGIGQEIFNRTLHCDGHSPEHWTEPIHQRQRGQPGQLHHRHWTQPHFQLTVQQDFRQERDGGGCGGDCH